MSSRKLMRSRWAAIGAAVAVTLGGGGLIGVSAASGDASSFESVTPVRILNTRTGEKLSGETLALQVTGEIETYNANGTTADATVVPSGANAVAVNVTVTGAETKGYVSAFPCATEDDDLPNASTLNFNPGVDLANSTVVEIGATGKVCFYVKGTAHLLADVQGYYTTAAAATAAIDAYTKTETDSLLDAKADVGDLDDLEDIVLWPTMTVQLNPMSLQVREDNGDQCDNTANMIGSTNIYTTIYTDVNAGSEDECFTIMPIPAPSGMHGARWLPAEIVVCADVNAGSEIDSIYLFGPEIGNVLGVLPVGDPSIADVDGCHAFDIYNDMFDTAGMWGFSSYTLQFGTSWTQNLGEINLKSVEVTFLGVGESGYSDPPEWVGDYASVTVYES